MSTTFSPADVARIASLAAIPATESEQKSLSDGFNTTIAVVDKINKLNVSHVSDSHMTKLENVFREDKVDETRMLTQKQALANAKNVHNGYVVVDQIISQDG